MFAFLLSLAAVPPGIAVSNTAPPQLPIPPGAVVSVRPSISPVTVLPPHSLPSEAIQPPHVVRDPQETLPLARYFSEDDYPTAALASGTMGGIVGFTLTIDPSGRVIGCAISKSSGSAALDAATCNIMRRRSRFIPAMDSNGNPTVGVIAQEIEWKAPSR